MMSCKKATHLLSQRMDRKLTPRETLSLNFHLMMCHGCTNFRNNLTFLRKACERVVSDTQNEAR